MDNSSKTKHWEKFLFVTIFGMPLLILVAFFTIWGIMEARFSEGCSDHLRYAAQTVDHGKAVEHAEKAIRHLEKEGLTKGHTDWFWKDPNNDIGAWYRDLKQATARLKAAKTPEAKDRAMLMLKKFLDKGTYKPQRIETYKQKTLMTILIWSLILWVLGIITLIICGHVIEKRQKRKAGKT